MLGQTISTIVILAVAYALYAWFRRRGYPRWWPSADGQDGGMGDGGAADGGHGDHHDRGVGNGDSGGHHHG